MRILTLRGAIAAGVLGPALVVPFACGSGATNNGFAGSPGDDASIPTSSSGSSGRDSGGGGSSGVTGSGSSVTSSGASGSGGVTGSGASGSEAGACTAQNCTGCCSLTGICTAGTTDMACGAGGGSCQDCTRVGGSCSAGSCGQGTGSSGAGSSGSTSGSSSGSSSSDSGGLGGGGGVTSTCIAGSQGCLCDSRGQCASGLTCTPKGTGQPSLCCSGSNCTGSATGIGSVCGAGDAAVAACTPGITVPAASGSNDTCGYLSSGFNENILLCDMTASGGGVSPAVIEVFYSDEHALTLGCATTTYPVSALPANPGAVYYPQTGDPACTDSSGRPLRPVLFVTDITADPNCTSGDQQNGGKAYDPVAIFGTWKNATENGTIGTPVTADPGPMNYWSLGTGADPVTATATANCPCTTTSCTQTTGRTGRGYGAEMRFEVGLVAYHSYRLQIMLHDGDQTQGGDSSEGCAVFCAGPGI